MVVIGASFIGSEAASSLKLKYKDDLNVHMISSDEFPLQRVFGKEIGALVKSEHEKAGVVLHMNNKVKEIKGEKGKVTSVVLGDGSEIPADLVIVG